MCDRGVHPGGQAAATGPSRVDGGSPLVDRRSSGSVLVGGAVGGHGAASSRSSAPSRRLVSTGCQPDRASATSCELAGGYGPRVDTARAETGAQPRRAACATAIRSASRRATTSPRAARPAAPRRAARGGGARRPEPRDAERARGSCRASGRRPPRRSSRLARRHRSRPSRSCDRAASSARRRSRSCATSSRSADVPRSGWLAIGAAVGAARRRAGRSATRRSPLVLVGGGRGAGRVAWLQRGSRDRADWRWSSVRRDPRPRRRSVLPVDRARRARRTDRGPWTMVVETVGAPREGTRSRRSGRSTTRRRRASGSPRRCPRYPAVEPGDVVVVDGRARERPDCPYGALPRPDRRVGHARRADARGPPSGRPDPATRLEAAPTRRGRAADPRPPRARGRSRGRHPDRAARPGRPGGRGGVHDRRRQPRRRDLGLEHRDRRGGRSRPFAGRLGRRRRSVVTAARDRRVHRVRRRVAVGPARGRDGRRRAAGPRDAAAPAGRPRPSAGLPRSCCSSIPGSSATPASSSRRWRRPG